MARVTLVAIVIVIVRVRVIAKRNSNRNSKRSGIDNGIDIGHGNSTSHTGTTAVTNTDANVKIEILC